MSASIVDSTEPYTYRGYDIKFKSVQHPFMDALLWCAFVDNGEPTCEDRYWADPFIARQEVEKTVRFWES